MGEALALLTAVVLICYLLAIIDDVVFDLYRLVWFGWRQPRGIPSERILRREPRRLAVMVPAWREAGVVTAMIRAAQDLAVYPVGRVDFFVGVYPNDRETAEDVRALSRERPDVHLVENWRPGPTTKSQNLNFLYRAIEGHEERHGLRYAGIAVHDAEDVIHPYAFRLYDALLDDHAMVQLPVFPLLPKRSFWRRLVAGTYADEFAEQHLHHVPIRSALGAFVPSAGTGFVVRRDVLDELAADGPIFHEEALTEDYELALRLRLRGHDVHFHLQRVRRVGDDGRVRREYVAVREHFPQEMAAAVRQKSRWIYGVALQTPRLVDPAAIRRLPLRDRLAIVRDRKGRFANLVHLIGYPLAFYALLSTIFPLPFGEVPLLWPLAVTVLAFTLLRLCMRAYFVGRVYGPVEALWAGFLPPLVPLRWLAGTYLNTRATLRAWRMFFAPGAGRAPGAAPVWDKTARRGYVDEEVLRDSRRRLGDDLIFFADLNARQVAELLRRQEQDAASPRLGRLAVEERLVSERELERITGADDAGRAPDRRHEA